MKHGDKAEVYGADNNWHECIYLCKSYANKGHYIIWKDGKPWECSFIRSIKEKEKDND